MNDTQIDHLIGARNCITDRTDEYIDLRAVDHIDAVLRDVPPGQRPDVDALLGRACAIVDALERAADEVGVKAEHLTPAQIARLNDLTDERSGIIEHDDWLAGAP